MAWFIFRSDSRIRLIFVVLRLCSCVSASFSFEATRPIHSFVLCVFCMTLVRLWCEVGLFFDIRARNIFRVVVRVKMLVYSVVGTLVLVWASLIGPE